MMTKDELLQVLDWQIDLIQNVYGTIDENQLRRYRICYVEIPKKNGKTELGAAIKKDEFISLNQLTNMAQNPRIGAKLQSKLLTPYKANDKTKK